jgi:hypothetical protein
LQLTESQVGAQARAPFSEDAQGVEISVIKDSEFRANRVVSMSAVYPRACRSADSVIINATAADGLDQSSPPGGRGATHGEGSPGPQEFVLWK